MHTLKVAAEFLLTLAVMRFLSWGLGWAFSRTCRVGVLANALVANAIALAIFTGVIVYNLLPGEPVDYAALTFGVVAYALFVLADLKWRPWHRHETRQ